MHQQIPADCLVIDDVSVLHVDIVVDITLIGKCTNQKLVVRVQNLLSAELEQVYWGHEGGSYFVG